MAVPIGVPIAIAGAGALSSIWGSISSNNTNREINEARLRAERDMNDAQLAAARRANAQAMDLAYLNREDQNRWMERNSLSGRLSEAEANGVHRLAALGMSPGGGYSPVTAMFSPEVATTTPSSMPSRSNGPEIAGHLTDMGQNISRALAAQMTEEERTAQTIQRNQMLEHGALSNELLRAQISSINQPTNPPYPGMDYFGLHQGGGNSDDGRVLFEPAKTTYRQPGAPEMEAGDIADTGLVKTRTGYAIVPSASMKSRMEDDWFEETKWKLRNYLRGFWDPPKGPAGHYYDPLNQSFERDKNYNSLIERHKRWKNERR